MENLMSISSFDNTKLNYNYVVKKENYSILQPTKGNRGGKDDKRIRYYIKKIKSGEFFEDLNIIHVDVFGNIVEGHHRVLAMMELEMEIPVHIVLPKTLSEISDFNSGMSPKWYASEAFNSARTEGSVVAILLYKMRLELCEKNKIDVKKFSEPEMYSVLVKDSKYCSGGKNAPTVGMWTNISLVSFTKKNEFKKNMRLYAEMKGYLKSIRDAYKISKTVLDLYFDDRIDFELDVFVEALSYEGFVLGEYKVPAIKAKALSMYQKHIRLSKVA